jgi:uncharacterized protein YggE
MADNIQTKITNSSWTKVVVVSAILFFVSGFLFNLQAVFTNLRNPAFPSKTVNSIGEYSLKADPDLAVLKFSISKSGKSPDIQTQIDDTENQIRESVSKLGFEESDVTVTYNSLNLNSENTADSQASRSFNLEVSGIPQIEKVSQVYEELSKISGLNQDGGCLGFVDIESVVSKYRPEALKKAKIKAQSMLSGSGLKLGKLFLVNDASDFYRFNRDQMLNQSGNCQPNGGKVRVESVPVTVQMNATYKVK